MNKVLHWLAFLVVILVFGMASCAAPSKEIDPLEVSLDTITFNSSDERNTTWTVTFTVFNPNDIGVTFDRLEYFITAGDTKLAAIQYNDGQLIEPGSEVKVNNEFTVKLFDLSIEKMASEGIQQSAAFSALSPFWKSLGGKLPGSDFQEVWDKATDEKLTFVVEGEVFMTAFESSSRQPFTDTFTEN